MWAGFSLHCIPALCGVWSRELSIHICLLCLNKWYRYWYVLLSISVSWLTTQQQICNRPFGDSWWSEHSPEYYDTVLMPFRTLVSLSSPITSPGMAVQLRFSIGNALLHYVLYVIRPLIGIVRSGRSLSEILGQSQTSWTKYMNFRKKLVLVRECRLRLAILTIRKCWCGIRPKQQYVMWEMWLYVWWVQDPTYPAPTTLSPSLW